MLSDIGDLLEPVVVCVLGRHKKPVGAGCVITDRHAITCAHVVAAAIGYEEYAVEKPADPVPIEFFLGGGDQATVETWWPVAQTGDEPRDGPADLALLRFSQPLPSWVKPARLAESDNLRHQNFIAKGYPAGQEPGVEAEGVFGGRRRDGWIQVQTQTGFPIEPGFSGSPVWIEAYKAIGGILVERIVNKAAPPLAFVIPPSLLKAIYPLVTEAVEPMLGRVLWVPDPPPGYLPRPELVAELKARLFAAFAPVAVSGVGGIGKTVLASALARDEEVQRAFPDGIYWLTLAQPPVVAQQILLAHELSKLPEEFADSQVGKARLEQLLSEKRSLVILDDVRSVADARAFEFENTPTQLLLTTRCSRVVEAVDPVGTKVPALSSAQARDLLASFSGQAVETLPEETAGIIAAANGLPLALAMAGRLAQGRPEAWMKRSVAQAIEASVAALPADAREIFFDLVVFPEDTPIPLKVLESFWAERGLTPEAVADYSDDFVARSLASWDEKRQGNERNDRLILHNLVIGYLRSKVTDRMERQRRLIQTQKPSSGKWVDLPAHASYLWTWLSYHLVEAGWQHQLKALLLDPNWLGAKLTATNVPAMIADYDQMSGDQDLLLIRRALTLSGHVLGQHPEQLTAQLRGRLVEEDGPAVAQLLGVAHADRSSVLVPIRTGYLTRPGALLRTIQTDGAIRAIAVLPDGRRALSSSDDNTLRLWNLDRGTELRRFEGHNGWVRAIAVLPGGHRALSGSGDMTLRLWNLDRGTELRRFEGHDGPVRAIAVMTDGRRALSGASDNTLRLWDLDSGTQLASFVFDGAISTMAVAKERPQVIVGQSGGRVIVLNVLS